MVDCRPAAGAAPHDLAHSAPNGAPPETHHNQQTPSNNEMGGHGITSPASVRASTPATTNAITTYTGGMNPGVGGMGGVGGVGAGGACGPYVCGVKSVVWCAGASPPPHAPQPPPPPHGVNPHVFKSVQANGADLPMNDIPTLRYYFNLGVECMWAAYGPPPHAPPRHYSPRDLAQDMQQLGLHEQNHKHKAGDKPALAAKPAAQRPLLGPRFKRGGNNQDNNQNQNNHNQNKGHNNNMGNKGPNNRRNSHPDGRNNSSMPPAHAAPAHAGYADDCVLEQPLLTLPYIPYPPPLYPIPYYPVDSDPAMMGMMGGMGYVGYDDGVEYGAPLQYYPHPPPHYPHPHPHPHPQHPHPQHPQHPLPHQPHQPHTPQPPNHHNHHQHHQDHK